MSSKEMIFYTLTIRDPHGERQAWIVDTPQAVWRHVREETGSVRERNLPVNGTDEWKTSSGHRIIITHRAVYPEPQNLT